MNKLEQLIKEANKVYFDEYPEMTGVGIEIHDVKKLALEFAKHILEESYLSATCSNKPKFNGDINYQVDRESITDTLNKYL